MVKNNILYNNTKMYIHNLILLGNDFLKLNNQTLFLNNLKNNIKTVMISDKSSYVNIHEIGAQSKIKKQNNVIRFIKKFNYNLYCLLNLENLNNYSWLKKRKTILMYQGSFFNNFNSLKKKIFCVIPTLSNFEENQYFINCFGFLKKTKKCINEKKSLKKKLKDILLKMNYFLTNSFLEYSNYYTVLYQYNEYNLDKQLNIILTICFEFSKKEIIYIKTMKKNQNNFYCRTTLNQNSSYCLSGHKKMKNTKYYV